MPSAHGPLVPICTKIGSPAFKISSSPVWPTLASCDLDLWSLTFDLQSWAFHALALQTNCANLQQNRFFRILRSQVGNEQRDGRKQWMNSEVENITPRVSRDRWSHKNQTTTLSRDAASKCLSSNMDTTAAWPFCAAICTSVLPSYKQPHTE